MGKLIHKKVRAATLLETIVALVIILVLFGIVTTVMVQTIRVSSADQKWKAIACINQVASDTRQQQSWFDEEIAMDGFILRKQVTAYDPNKKLFQLSLSVYDQQDRLIVARQQLLRPEQPNE